MALNNIEYGAIASSEVMNENFSYLDNRITETSESIMTSISSIYSNIATINTRLSDIAENLTKTTEDLSSTNNNLNSQLSSNKQELLSKINQISMLPDWTNMIYLASLNSYTALANGFVMLISTMEDVGDFIVNGKSVPYKRRTLSYDNSSQLVSIPVKKGDLITCTCPTLAIYFVPVVQLTLS